MRAFFLLLLCAALGAFDMPTPYSAYAGWAPKIIKVRPDQVPYGYEVLSEPDINGQVEVQPAELGPLNPNAGLIPPANQGTLPDFPGSNPGYPEMLGEYLQSPAFTVPLTAGMGLNYGMGYNAAPAAGATGTAGAVAPAPAPAASTPSTFNWSNPTTWFPSSTAATTGASAPVWNGTQWVTTATGAAGAANALSGGGASAPAGNVGYGSGSANGFSSTADEFGLEPTYGNVGPQGTSYGSGGTTGQVFGVPAGMTVNPLTGALVSAAAGAGGGGGVPGGYSAYGPALIGAGASLLGGYLGSNATSAAAEQQLQGTREATAEQRRQYDLTRQDQLDNLARARADSAPWLTAGTGAINTLSALTATPGQGLLAPAPAMRPFTEADLNSDVVYNNGLEFGANQGRDAINARAIATGGYDSGATLKALTRFGNDYGTTKASGAYDRFRSYDTENYNRFNTDTSNIYNRLAGVAGTGQTAVNTVTNAGTNTTNAITNAGTNSANNISTLDTSAGNARAAGIVGGANAWAGALGGVTSAVNNYQSNLTLQALLAGRPQNTTSFYGN